MKKKNTFFGTRGKGICHYTIKKKEEKGEEWGWRYFSEIFLRPPPSPFVIIYEGVFSIMVVMHINFSNLKNKWIDKVLKFNRISECKPETIHIMDV